ncbi:MAG: hypothetical protein Aureis2KO_17350 [Aureisphaera sp.]
MHGYPNLNQEQMDRYFNIVYLEGCINGAKSHYREMKQLHKTNISAFKFNERLDFLTNRMSPEDLINEMIQLSQID